MDFSYVGHESQIRGVEAHRLQGGKGDGMRILQVKNGLGLEFTVSCDRCADLSRLSFRGFNMGYFSPAGYVAPAYYQDWGTNFLKSFTAGFLTTCGLTAVGNPCLDAGESLPLHGTISNVPAEHISWDMDDKVIVIRAVMNDEIIFGRKLRLCRKITCPLDKNEFTITDTVQNRGDSASPLMLLYHMNMGYPLLSEHAVVEIPSVKVTPRNARAAQDIDSWNQMLPPTQGFEEQCYFHQFTGQGKASIYNPQIGVGLQILFDSENLPYFTQWKMMGIRDYVLGLEPGNCHPDGRDVMRREGTLAILEPGAEKTYSVTVKMLENREV